MNFIYNLAQRYDKQSIVFPTNQKQAHKNTKLFRKHVNGVFFYLDCKLMCYTCAALRLYLKSTINLRFNCLPVR